MDPAKLIDKAKDSKFWLYLLNRGLWRFVPFNKPHALEIVEIREDGLKVFMPYKRSNLNHIKGIHACGLATLVEYTCGLTLTRKFPFDKYRLIMGRLEMDYHYQAKCGVYADFEIGAEEINEKILNPLKTAESVTNPFEVKISDEKGNHICTGKVFWQIKEWNKVKTAVS